MSGRWERLDTEKIATGLGLATVGVILMANKLDYWAHVWKLWPLWLGFVGLGKLAAHPSRRLYGDGLMMIAMCFFFLAVTFRWYGLSYRNSWPLIIVIVGLSLVVSSFTGKNHGVVMRFRTGKNTLGGKEDGREVES